MRSVPTNVETSTTRQNQPLDNNNNNFVNRATGTVSQESTDQMFSQLGSGSPPPSFIQTACARASETTNDVNVVDAPLLAEQLRDPTLAGTFNHKHAQSVVFYGPTGVGKTTTILHVLGKNFELKNSQVTAVDTTPSFLRAAVGAVTKIVTKLTCTSTPPEGADIGYGMSSTTSYCTGYKRPDDPLLYVDTAGLRETRGQHKETFQSLIFTHAVRMCDSIRIACLLDVTKIVSLLTSRDQVVVVYNDFKGVAQLLNKHPDDTKESEHLDALLVLLTKFERPHDPAAELGQVWAALTQLKETDCVQQDVQTKSVITHTMDLIQKHQFDLVVCPADSIEGNQKTTQATRAAKIRTMLANLSPMKPTDVGAPITPTAIQSIEKSCLQMRSDIQSRLSSENEAQYACDAVILRHLDDLKLLSQHSGIESVTTLYHTAIDTVVTFVKNKFKAAMSSLSKHEFSSCAELLRKAGDRVQLEMYSRDHPDTAVFGIDQEWHNAAHAINELATQLLADVRSKGNGFSMMVDALKELKSMNMFLIQYLVSEPDTAYNSALTYVKTCLQTTHDAAESLIMKREFDESLCNLLDQLADGKTMRPFLGEERKRLYEPCVCQVETVVDESASDFAANSTSVGVLLRAKDQATHALACLYGIKQHLASHVALLTAMTATKSLETYTCLQEEAVRLFEASLKQACSFKHVTLDTTHWSMALQYFHDLHQVCDIQSYVPQPSIVITKATETLTLELVDFRNAVSNDVGALREHPETIVRVGPQLHQLQSAFDALCNHHCQHILPSLGDDLHTLAAEVEHYIHNVIATASTGIRNRQPVEIRSNIVLLEGLMTHGMFDFVSARNTHTSPHQTPNHTPNRSSVDHVPNITQSRVNLMSELCHVVNQMCRNAHRSAHTARTHDMVTDEDVHSFAKLFAQLNTYAHLLPDLQISAPTCSLVMMSVQQTDITTPLSTPQSQSQPQSRSPRSQPRSQSQSQSPSPSMTTTVQSTDTPTPTPMSTSMSRQQNSTSRPPPRYTEAPINEGETSTIAPPPPSPTRVHTAHATTTTTTPPPTTPPTAATPSNASIDEDRDDDQPYSFEMLGSMVLHANNSLSQGVLTYATRCSNRCVQSVTDNNIKEAQAMMDTLSCCHETCSDFFVTDAEEYVSPLEYQLEVSKAHIRETFQQLHTQAAKAIDDDKMVEAREFLQRIEALLVFEGLFTETRPRDMAMHLHGEYRHKSDDFTARATQLWNKRLYQELADLIMKADDFRNANDHETSQDASDQCARFKQSSVGIAQQFAQRVQSICNQAGNQAKFRQDLTLPPAFEDLAGAMRWFHDAAPLAEALGPPFGACVQQSTLSVVVYLNQLHAHALEHLETSGFCHANNARQSFATALENNLCIDLVTQHLENLDAEMATTAITLVSKLETIVTTTDSPNTQDLDDLFNGVRDSKSASPKTSSMKAISNQMDPLQNRLRDVLETHFNKTQEAFEVFDFDEGDRHERILKRLITTSSWAARIFDKDTSPLVELRKYNVEEMFTPRWLIENSSNEEMKQRFLAFSGLERASMTNRFLGTYVRQKRNDFELCFDDGPTCNVVLLNKAKRILSEFPKFSDYFPKHGDEIRDTVASVYNCVCEQVEKVLQEANVHLQNERVEEVAKAHAPFLKKVDTVLTLFVPPNEELRGQVAEFVKDVLYPDKSELVTKWRTHIDALEITQRFTVSAADVGSFVKELDQRQPFIQSIQGLPSYISSAKAKSKLKAKLGADAIKEAATRAIADDNMDALTAMQQNVDSLYESSHDDGDCVETIAPLFQNAKAVLRTTIADQLATLEGEIANDFTNAMRSSSSTTRASLMEGVNLQLEQADRIGKVSNGGAVGRASSSAIRNSPAIGVIKFSLTTQTDTVLQYVKNPVNHVRTTEHMALFYRTVAEELLSVYEAPAAISDENVSAHVHQCISSILTAFKAKANTSLAQLEEYLRGHELGHEIVESQTIFSRERLQKLNTALATLAPADATKKLKEENGLSDEQHTRLTKYWKSYHKTYLLYLKHYSHAVDVVRAVKSTFICSSKTGADKLVELVAGVAATWTLEKSPADGGRGGNYLQPHAAQILTIFRLLQLDDSTDSSLYSYVMRAVRTVISSPKRLKLVNHIAQVKTGQGKSVILGITATVLAMLNLKVDCACYSTYLSERDMEDFKPIFNHFEVTNSIAFSTFSNLSERLMNEQGDVRQLTNELCGVRSSVSPVTKNPKKGRVLLIDEIDTFFSDDFYGNTYNPATLIQNPEVNALLRFAWKNQALATPALEAATFKHSEFATLISLLRNDVHMIPLIKTQFRWAIRDLKSFVANPQPADQPQQHYQVVDGKVCYRTQDTMSSNIAFGYRTLWAYFKEHDNGLVKPEVLEENLALNLPCGEFSYAEIPKRYSFILGVTGTLEHCLASKFGKQVLKGYDINNYTLMPSVFGTNKLVFREVDDVCVVREVGDYYRQIQEGVAKAIESRPVLVFFESEADLRAWRDSDYGECKFHNNELACITASTPNIDHYITRASRVNKVTLLSREHGRGLDFNGTSDMVDAAGGIHIIQAFFSDDPSEEEQIKGRSGRMGKNGTYTQVLLLDQLTKFGVTEDEVATHEKGGKVTVYAMLCEKRIKFVDEMSTTRTAAAAAAFDNHTKSLAYQRDLVQAATSGFATNTAPCFDYLRSMRPIKENDVRIVILSDATYSMDDLWDASRNHFKEMLSRIEEISGDTQPINVMWVAYRDYDRVGSTETPMLESSGWSSDAATLIRFVGKITCAGGGDIPEAIELALKFVNKLDLKPSRVLLFGDAPPHEEGQGSEVEYHKKVLETDYINECKQLKASEIPLHTFYMHRRAKATFEKMAEITGGEATELDRTRIQAGDVKQLLDAVCEQALEEIGANLSVDLVSKYRARFV